MAKVIMCLIQFLVFIGVQIVFQDAVNEDVKEKKHLNSHSRKTIKVEKGFDKKYLNGNSKTLVKCI